MGIRACRRELVYVRILCCSNQTGEPQLSFFFVPDE